MANPKENTGIYAIFDTAFDIQEQDRILASLQLRIRRSQSRSLRIRAISHGFIVIAAAVAFVPVATYLTQSLSQSGFYSFISLAASDWSYLSGHWNELALSLADSLPLTGGIMIVGVSLIFINSLKRAVIDASALYAL